MSPVHLAELPAEVQAKVLKQIEATEGVMTESTAIVLNKPTVLKETFGTLPAEMDTDQLAGIVIEGVRKFRHYLPYVFELKKRFDSAERDSSNRIKEPIKGCYSWQEFCSNRLDRTPQHVGELMLESHGIPSTCPECGDSFPSKSKLRKHQNRKHPSPVQPVKVAATEPIEEFRSEFRSYEHGKPGPGWNGYHKTELTPEDIAKLQIGDVLFCYYGKTACGLQTITGRTPKRIHTAGGGKELTASEIEMYSPDHNGGIPTDPTNSCFMRIGWASNMVAIRVATNADRELVAKFKPESAMPEPEQTETTASPAASVSTVPQQRHCSWTRQHSHDCMADLGRYYLEDALDKWVRKIVLQPYGYYAAKFKAYPQQHTTELAIIENQVRETYQRIVEIASAKASAPTPEPNHKADDSADSVESMPAPVDAPEPATENVFA